MLRLLRPLTALLGFVLLTANAASALALASAQNRASGSATVADTLIRQNTRLSEGADRENLNLRYDLASDSPVAAEAGTATISEYATAAGSHFSIDVAVGNESLATEQLMVDGVGNTSIGVNASTGAVRTRTMTLPDGQAALGYSRGLIGTDTGVYNSLTNSCLSYCGNVLNAGGLNVPLNSTLGTIRFLRGLGQ